jgi:hypothetical protein
MADGLGFPEPYQRMADQRMDSEQLVWTGCAGGYDTGWCSYSYDDNNFALADSVLHQQHARYVVLRLGDTAIGAFTMRCTA